MKIHVNEDQVRLKLGTSSYEFEPYRHSHFLCHTNDVQEILAPKRVVQVIQLELEMPGSMSSDIRNYYEENCSINN